MGQTIINLVFFGVLVMKIDLRALKHYPGKSEHFELEYKGDKDLLGMQGSFLDSVKVSIQVHNNGRFFNGKGIISTRAELVCSRCLEALIWPISTDMSFSVGDEPESQAQDKDENYLFYGSGLVDLEPLVGEYIVTELPFTPVCREDCQGLCPACGSNRNLGSCSCKNDDIDPRWEKLKNLQ